MNTIDFLVRKDQFTITELRETPALLRSKTARSGCAWTSSR
jgi:hypothetical protein